MQIFHDGEPDNYTAADITQFEERARLVQDIHEATEIEIEMARERVAECVTILGVEQNQFITDMNLSAGAGVGVAIGLLVAMWHHAATIMKLAEDIQPYDGPSPMPSDLLVGFMTVLDERVQVLAEYMDQEYLAKKGAA